MIHRFCLCALLSLTSSAWADSININASGRGWVCAPAPSCNAEIPGGSNNGASFANNYLAGNQPGFGQFRDWFEFGIPSFSGESLISGTLKLDQGIPIGHVGDALTFTVYGLTAQPMAFADVTTTRIFGSVGTSVASNGFSVTIQLNSAALTAITEDQGGNIFIGGIDSGENSPLLSAWDFGDTGGINQTVLGLTTVPEPSTLLLLLQTMAVMTLLRGKAGLG